MTGATIVEHRGIPYRRAGKTGLLLPALSLGLWQNFGADRDQRTQSALITGAFDRGITHFDNANRYGPPHGWAEQVLGDVIRRELFAHRDEITITTKAGNPVADHPYATGGSRKHILDAVDASLARLGVDHVDVFYSHRYDPTTPLEETVSALAEIVQQGKARYLGLSNYPPRFSRAPRRSCRRGMPRSRSPSRPTPCSIEEPSRRAESWMRLQSTESASSYTHPLPKGGSRRSIWGRPCPIPPARRTAPSSTRRS